MKLLELSVISCIFLISFLINFYFGHQGLMPLDDLQNFNSGHRVLKGDFPFRDYYSITGPILDICQSFIYKIFGSNWQSLVTHASLLNSSYSISFFFFLKKLNFSLIQSFIYSISSGLLMFPPTGNPTVEHNSLTLSVISLFIFIIGLKEKKNYLLFFSVFIFGIAFFTKQVPTAYFVLFCILIYFFQIFAKINKSSFITLFLSSLFVIVFFFTFFLFNRVILADLINQYFIISTGLGENRLASINFTNFYDNISKIFFLLFLIIPSAYYSFITKKLNNFIIIFGLSLIIVVYEIHSNNQPITFSLLPVFLSLFYYFAKNENLNLKFVRYFFYLIITYCFYRILRYEFFYIIFFLAFLPFVFFKKNLLLKHLVIIYLFISSSFYFEKYVKIRGWDDLRKNEVSKSFDGELIDNKLKYLKWKTAYFDDIELEKKVIFFTLDYLKNLDPNIKFILISDYQIYNLILDKKDFSPVKYWHKNATYPSKNHHLRSDFEIFFKSKILNNNVSQIIVDNTAGFKSGELTEFDWLYKCLIEQSVYDQINIDIFIIKENCII